MTDVHENEVLNLMRAAGISAFTAYFALCTTAPTDAAAGTEVSGGSYARQPVTFGAPSAGSMSSSADITFPTATGVWGTVTHWEIWDAASAGNRKYWGALTASRTIGVGDILKVLAGQITVTID